MKRRCEIENCGGAHVARGWCGKHYRRWWEHGDPHAYLFASLKARFWAKVAKVESVTECWLWQGSRINSGYGVIGRSGKRAKNVLAHRLSWELAFGEIPAGLFVCHHCDVKLCVRPAHLFLGTAADNAADMVAKGRQSDGQWMRLYPERVSRGPKHGAATPIEHRSRGESHGRHRLTEAMVQEIRRRLASGEPSTLVAADYGISFGHALRIQRRQTWRWLEEAEAEAQSAA